MPATRLKIFISSVQKEFKQTRLDLKAFLLGDAVLHRFVSESLYLTRYIEKAGSGTQRMIELCKEAGLPEPQFEQRSGFFIITLWRDWLTEEIIGSLGLNDRQQKAITYVKVHGRITNKNYREVTRTIIRTASRDLEDLVSKGVMRKIGVTGRNAHYVLAREQDVKRTNRT